MLGWGKGGFGEQNDIQYPHLLRLWMERTILHLSFRELRGGPGFEWHIYQDQFYHVWRILVAACM
jgi:hypothetical protein